MGPVNWVSPRNRTFRLLRLPNSGGMGPVKRLSAMNNSGNSVRRPNSAGNRPVNPVLGKFRWVTLPPESVLTPFQVARGASLSQLVLKAQLGPSVALYRAIRYVYRLPDFPDSGAMRAPQNGSPGCPN